MGGGFDLCGARGASEQQFDLPIRDESGRDGWCVRELEDPRDNLHPLLDVILDHVPQPDVAHDAPFAMLATLLASDPYLGLCLVGRLMQGQASLNYSVRGLNLAGPVIDNRPLSTLLSFYVHSRVPGDKVMACDIVCIAGRTKSSGSYTICVPEVTVPLRSTPIDPPTMSVNITVND